MSRFNAFKLGSSFNDRLLVVTGNRIRANGIVQSSYFTKRCSGDGVQLQQVVVPGAPRLLSAGAGVNTEGVLLGKVSWSNTRFDSAGSLLEVSAYGSARLQRLLGKFNWYLLPQHNRLYLNPSIQLIHRNEIPFELVSAEAQLGLATTVDTRGMGVSLFAGPIYNYSRTLRGPGAPFTNIFALEARGVLKSHDYEYYTGFPQTGFIVTMIADLSDRAIFSSVTAQRFYVRGEKLWNLGSFDPPLWIFGLRGGYSTIITSDTTGPGTLLPANYIQYLGGSFDIRGFGRKELPLDQSNANLTSGFLGIEARLSHTLPYGFDPFVFADVGALGRNSFTMGLPVYWSPGLGVRWASPVGPVRMTIAHGFINSAPDHFQFYFSFGEEF
jgi:translocation and assembly module TamA